MRSPAKSSTEFWDKVTKERRKWDEMLDKQADPARSKDRIHPQAVARTVGDLAKRNAVFTLDTGLNTLWSANWIRQSGAQRIIGSFNNAVVGTALGQANGVQALDRSRQVIALCGEGELFGLLHPLDFAPTPCRSGCGMEGPAICASQAARLPLISRRARMPAMRASFPLLSSVRTVRSLTPVSSPI
jgi:hypothetical protein